MSKVRVYELAKEYGMKGPTLAKLLKDHGFETVKSHMAVLDDATELHARAVMEARGLSQQSTESTVVETEIERGSPRKKALPTLDGEPGMPSTKIPQKKALPPPVGRKPVRRKLPDDGMAASAAEDLAPAAAEAPAAELEAKGVETETAPAAEAPPVIETVRESARKTVRESTREFVRETVRESAREFVREPTAAAAEPAAAVAETAPAEAPPAAEVVAKRTVAPADQPARETGVAAAPQSSTPAEADASAAGAQPATEKPSPPPKMIKRLLVPEQKATVIGRIELPQEAISDAKRRSAPSTGRNPGGVDRNLRRAALRNTQTRSATRTGARPGGRTGTGIRRGPGVGGPGRRGGGRPGRRQSGGAGTLTSTVDPNKVVEIVPPISVKNLSEALGIKVNDLIAALTFSLGVIGKNINSFLSPEEVELVALEVGRKIKVVERQEAEEALLQTLVSAAKDVKELTRPPVVTFMGHVDHGKTSLLDALRSSDIVRGEAGGITQHIGAYRITRPNQTTFVVLDTPGHEAFTAMRARGAKITDVVVLVVAADDGVMPQTEEAIAHSKDAKVPIVVAINKCDKPDANPMQVKQQLAVKGLQPEDWGGNTQIVEVSAVTGQGLDDLAEKIMLEAELLELRAKPDAAGEGVVIESKQTPEQGVMVNVLVTDGTLKLRDQVLCGESLSRVRGIIDDHGNQLTEAGPSTPVQLLGLTSLPSPGDKLHVVTDKKRAREVVEDRQRQSRNYSLAERSKVTLENLSATLEAKKIEEIKVILKADVMGSLEPIKDSLAKLGTDEVRVNIIHSALGGITDADVSLAEASGAIVVGFNTVADQSARTAADRAGVEIRYYNVIYQLLDEVKLAMEGLLRPDEVEEVQGHAEIRAVFRSSKFGNIAGLFVLDGSATRNNKVRLSRDGKVVYTGSIQSLRREKDDAREVKAGFECGMTLKDFNDIKEGDQLEFFSVKLVKRTLA